MWWANYSIQAAEAENNDFSKIAIRADTIQESWRRDNTRRYMLDEESVDKDRRRCIKYLFFSVFKVCNYFRGDALLTV